ncbi:hypothetical protein [Pyrococcus yayanosii]|uniref:Uncharacterized protein n=1 Tax=Pyrococcus yayanosii (strain CH1 / JCM 16557) TaxID=529709 RepID=F8AFD5_PYRYC|nr:hypothetical protein [Pyrococcus yayanosii]AEH23742.1 hypothetical protein PYCH_00290 [Pyrococcus yayanosii CH1]
MKYINITSLNYKKMEDLEYMAALTEKVPYYDFKEKKAKFIEKEKVKEISAELAKKGMFAEAKELLEAAKKDYLKELEKKLVPKTVPLRISFPSWIKLQALALKYETSPSAILRKLLITATQDLIETLKKDGIITQRAYETIKNALNRLEKIKERRTFNEDEKGRKFVIIYEHEEQINPSDLKHIHHFLKHLVKTHASKENIPEEIVDLLFEKNITSDFKTPEAFFYTYAGIFKENDEVFLKFGCEVNTLDIDHVVFEYPVRVVQEFPPETILKFHRKLGFEAFVECPHVIEKIKAKLASGESITLEDYKDIFCHKFDKEIEVLFRASPEKLTFTPKLLPYLFEDYPLPLFKMTFSKDELRINGIRLRKKAKRDEIDKNIEELKKRIKEAYWKTLNLTEKEVLEAESKLKAGYIDETTLETLAIVKGLELFVHYLVRRNSDGGDILSAFTRPSEVFTTTFPKPLIRILELFHGKKIKDILEEMILEEPL